LDDPVDWVPPPLTIEVAVSMNDPVIRRLNQAEEQGDRKEQPKAVQPLPDLWLYPSSQAAQMMHRSPNSRQERTATFARTFVSNRGCAYFDLIFAASSARFFCHASYSGVPRRGGTSFGIPPSHVGTLSATTPLTAGLGSVAQAGSIMQVMATSAGLVALNFMTAITRPNHA
jgi:hypothetical protein